MILVHLWAPFWKHGVDGDSILERFWSIYAPFSMLLFHYERVFENYYTRLHQKHACESVQTYFCHNYLKHGTPENAMGEL
jgi:hypothetical protein